MFLKKSHIIVGLTTFYNEYLELSIPALARLGHGFTLIIHNDNPNTRVTARMIRRLGYDGPLHIINSEHNIGLLASRLSILDFVTLHRLQSQWFVFVDDDDFLVSLDIPDVSDNNFAVIQNMAVIRNRLIDVLCVAHGTYDGSIDGQDIILVRPHIGLAGTLVRFAAVLRMGSILHDMHDVISDIDASLSYRPPVDMLMWSVLNIVSRHDDELASPIYMDTVNYIATDIDTVTTKYGMLLQPSKNPVAQIGRAIAKYESAARSLLAATDAAAPVGA